MPDPANGENTAEIRKTKEEIIDEYLAGLGLPGLTRDLLETHPLVRQKIESSLVMIKFVRRVREDPTFLASNDPEIREIEEKIRTEILGLTKDIFPVNPIVSTTFSEEGEDEECPRGGC